MDIFTLQPGSVSYGHPMAAAILCASLLAFAVGAVVRRRQHSATGYARQGLKAWGTLLFVFGVIGVMLGVSRAENIVFLAMPFLQILWALLLAVSSVIHLSLLRKRSYTILPSARVVDPRDEYLPKKRRR